MRQYTELTMDANFWGHLEKTAAKVATWPEWKTGTMHKDNHLTWPQRKAKEIQQDMDKRHEEYLRRKRMEFPLIMKGLAPSPKYGILCGIAGCDHGTQCHLPNCKSVLR